jgi:protein required for attachment to host cells
MKNKHLIILILALQFLSVSFYAQSAPQQTKEEKKKAEQERKAQESQTKEQQKQQEKQAKESAKKDKQSAAKPLQVVYDRFTNETVVSFWTTAHPAPKFLQTPIPLLIGAAYGFQGTTVPQNKNVLLKLQYEIESYYPARDSGLILLVDNEPLDFGQLKEGSRSTRTFRNITTTTTVLYTEISDEVIQRLANAKVIEGRFSGIVFTVTPKYMTTLRELIK